MSKHKTLRITKFGGINKSDQPHSIKDNEFADMENFDLTKNLTLQSRRGYEKIGDIADTNYTKTVFKTVWTAQNQPLYYIDKAYLKKMDETDGAVTTIAPWSGSRHVKMLRYKDKVLALSNTSGLFWFDEDEDLQPVKYPNLKYHDDISGGIASSADSGALEVDYDYDYTVSFWLGDEGRDGETAGALPGDGEITFLSTKIGAGHDTVSGDATYMGELFGFDLTQIRLFRRKAKRGDGVSSIIEDWVLVDTATIQKVFTGPDWEYEMVGGSLNGIITAITGGYYPTDIGWGVDVAGVNVALTDHRDDTYDAGYIPYDAVETVDLQARYMTRFHNRILLANLTGGTPQDTKRVWYSYRGWNEASQQMDIPGFYHPDPMLIFPYTNYFYCDAEDVEDEITAIDTLGNSVIIFTSHCMFLWREGMSDPVKISDTVGCLGHQTVQEFEGKLLWLGSDGVYQYDGSKLTNLTFAKMQPYIDNIAGTASYFASAAVHDRKYFISAFFNGGASTDGLLVYDLDLGTWTTYQYREGSSDFNIHTFYSYHDGDSETLYAAGFDTAANCDLVKLETGWTDNGTSVVPSFKMKYYDFGVPDITKVIRTFLIDIANKKGTVDVDFYLDNLNEPRQSFSHAGSGGGFIVNDPVNGWVNHHYIVNTTDEIMQVSMMRGASGARVQFGVTLEAAAAPLEVRMVGFGWLAKHRIRNRYGG